MSEPMDVEPSAGLKRKADDPPASAPAPRRIRALDPAVVNRIAAGEIIVAPVHALKEMIENSVDAGATSLEVVVKDGGLKLLQITDNGCGIQKDDLAILCERHTTSKISAFEDLASIATYGFRGEALASISHIAHLSVTTKTKDSACAWRAHYLDGELVPAKPGQSAEPKPVAGRPGTQITVEDLFFNVPTRRRAFRSPSDEYNKILDMVGRYAIHRTGVAFSCKRQGDPNPGVTVQAAATVQDRIRQIYGSEVAKELVQFSAAEKRWGFTAEGWTTNANYHVKKGTLLLFINHRCVESTAIKKSIEQLYAAFLPKGTHPFSYLSLEIDPVRVDVNVHPTKREVHFLNEEEITQSICEAIRSKLAAVDSSRTFTAQTMLPAGQWSIARAEPQEDMDDDNDDDDDDDDDDDPLDATPVKRGAPPAKRARRHSNTLVRTDTAARKITSMFQRVGSSAAGSAGPAVEDHSVIKDGDAIEYKIVEKEHTACRLASVKELRAEVREDMHEELTEIFAGHTFVGVVDERRRLAAMQGGIKLLLVDYGHACYEYFYQLGLTDFGNFGFIRFSPPLDVRELLRIAAQIEKRNVESPEDDFDVEQVVERVASQLVERREMLCEYFSFEVTPAYELVSLPLLIKGYTPPIVKLPRFLLRLGPMVNWTEEKACFETFLRELATFYVPEQLPPAPGNGGAEGEAGSSAAADDSDVLGRELNARRRHVRRAVEHVFFPAFKTRLIATHSLMKNGVMEVANLKGLYKVFERC